MHLALTYSAYLELQALPDRDACLAIGEAMLKLQDNPTPKAAAVVCGDCLFLELGPHAILYQIETELNRIVVLGIVNSGWQTLH